jgi:hypothetical protein
MERGNLGPGSFHDKWNGCSRFRCLFLNFLFVCFLIRSSVWIDIVYNPLFREVHSWLGILRKRIGSCGGASGRLSAMHALRICLLESPFSYLFLRGYIACLSLRAVQSTSCLGDFCMQLACA